MTITDKYREAADWDNRLAAAEAMIPLVGELYRRRGVVTSLHGASLVNRSTIEIIKAHRFARHLDDVELLLSETLPLIQGLLRLDIRSVSVDVAVLAHERRRRPMSDPLDDFLLDVLGPTSQGERAKAQPRDVVLYGFGRIGRIVARLLIEHEGGASALRLRAVVVRRSGPDDLRKRAGLLRRDSVHGPFAGTITLDEEHDTVLANGTLIRFIYAEDPAEVDYRSYGIDDAILVDNTGRWRDETGLRRHLLAPGVARVLLTAPGKGTLKNIVHGVNHDSIDMTDLVLSAASCTTNAITPVLQVIDAYAGVHDGHVETVHSFTNDQNLIDNLHPGNRRGRSAALNMVITETGAAKAVAKALPSFAGKLTGSAIRVPTPDVSLAILNLRLERPVTRQALNAHLRLASLDSPLRRQIDYVESPDIVSTDILGSRHAGVVDGLATIAERERAVVYVWYDNEFGYSCQVVRVIESMAGVHLPALPRPIADQVGVLNEREEVGQR